MEIRLTHISGGYAGRQDVLSKDRITFGRAADNDVRLSPQDVRASAHHAVLFVSDEGVVVEDLDSTNGTYVNGVRVHRARIQSGDVLQFGRRGPSVMVEILVPAEEAQPAAMAPTDPTLVESVTSSTAWRVGRTTVQLMIDQAVRRSTRVWRRWIVGVAIGVIVAIGITLGILWRGERERSASVEETNPLVRVAVRNQAAVVLIQHHFRILDARGREVSTALSEGSGFAIDPRGVIATNYHLVRPWEFDARFAGQAITPVSHSLKVIFADRAPDEALEARLVRGSPEMDICLLYTSPSPRDS